MECFTFYQKFFIENGDETSQDVKIFQIFNLLQLSNDKRQIDADLADASTLDIYCILWWLMKDNLNCFHISRLNNIPTSSHLVLHYRQVVFSVSFSCKTFKRIRVSMLSNPVTHQFVSSIQYLSIWVLVWTGHVKRSRNGRKRLRKWEGTSKPQTCGASVSILRPKRWNRFHIIHRPSP